MVRRKGAGHNTFRQHGFFTHWAALKADLETLEVPDKIAETPVLELNRLRNAAEFLEEVLALVDPELLPASLLDPLVQPAESVVNQTRAFRRNQNQTHLTKANAQLDQILAALRRYATSAVSAVARSSSSNNDWRSSSAPFACSSKVSHKAAARARTATTSSITPPARVEKSAT